MGGGDDLHALQCLEPALGLAGFRRLVAEAIDELPHVRDLPLLLLVLRLLQCELFGAHAFEGRIVALVQGRPAPLDVHDVADDAVEEVAVVRDEQERAGIVAQPALEPDHGIEIEMIRRLVEQQQRGTAHQGTREVQPDPPASGEFVDRTDFVFRREAETVQEPARAGPRGVAVDRFELGVQGREPLAVPRTVGGRNPSLELAQLPVAVENVIDCRALAVRRLLGDVRDDPVRRQADAAGVRLQLARHQREQAGLAAAVRARDADLLARVDLERRVLEQEPRAAAQGDVRELEHGGGLYRLPGP